MYPFSPGSYAPRNCWYVAAFIKDIGEDLLERWILNTPVVLYRKADGTAVAVDGRCPHRHFPLGKSRRVGDAIQCGYHGITFDHSGACTFVPSQTTIPGVYSIAAYPLVESGLWAWIWLGDPEKADASLIPTLEEIDFAVEGLIPYPFFSLEVAGRYQLLNDNLLDLSHLSYLHGNSIGTATDAETAEVRDVNDRRLSSRRDMIETDMTAMMMSLTEFRGKVDRITGMDFFAPGFHAGIGDTLIAQSEAGAGEYLHRGRVWHGVTPSTKHSSWYFFAMTVPSLDDVERARNATLPVLDEDILATVEIEKIVAGIGESALPQELMIRSDQTAVMGRRMVQAMMDREAAG
jgi:phenylpropionate dioxygenase-like ring-hydroxylating dioxygenase large terminal subunit